MHSRQGGGALRSFLCFHAFKLHFWRSNAVATNGGSVLSFTWVAMQIICLLYGRYLRNNDHIWDKSISLCKRRLVLFLFSLQWWIIYILKMKYCSVLAVNCNHHYSVKVNDSAAFCCGLKKCELSRPLEMVYPQKKKKKGEGGCKKAHIHTHIHTDLKLPLSCTELHKSLTSGREKTLWTVFLCIDACLGTVHLYGLPVQKMRNSQLSVSFQSCSPRWLKCCHWK